MAIGPYLMIATIYWSQTGLYGAFENLGDNDPKIDDGHCKQTVWTTLYLKSLGLVIHTQLRVRMYPAGFAQKIVEMLPDICVEQRKFNLEVDKLLSWSNNLCGKIGGFFLNPKCFLPRPLLDIVRNHLGLRAFDSWFSSASISL